MSESSVKLACISGFRVIQESQPHGTNHAGLSSIQSIARTGYFGSIDFFTDEAESVGRKGSQSDLFLAPDGVTSDVFDTTDLLYSADQYLVALAPGGGTMENRSLYHLRLDEHPLPIVAEIDCSNSRIQWNNLLLASITGRIRPNDGLIFKSKATARLFREVWDGWDRRFPLQCPLPEALVSPNSVNPDFNKRDEGLRSLVRAQLGIGENLVAFLLFSRIERHTKGDIPSLLVKWAEVLRSQPEAVLILAGLSAESEYLVELHTVIRALRIGHRVIVLPNPYENWKRAKTALMSAADAFIHVSTGLEESAPLTILEAFAHGLPAIVADWSGLGEQVIDGQTGFKIPLTTSPVPESAEHAFCGTDFIRANVELSQFASICPKAFVQAANLLSSDPQLRRTFGDRARKFIETDRNPDREALARVEFMVEMTKRPSIGSRQSRILPVVAAADAVQILGGCWQFSRSASISRVDDTPVAGLLSLWVPKRLVNVALLLLANLDSGPTPLRELVCTVAAAGAPRSESDWDSEIGLHLRWIVLRLAAAGILKVEEEPQSSNKAS